MIPDLPVELQVFVQHRTIRFYKKKPLAAGHFNAIIEAGRRTPTDALCHMYWTQQGLSPKTVDKDAL